MKESISKQLNDEQMEPVGTVADDAGWRELYNTKYRPDLISKIRQGSLENEKVWKWLIGELDCIVFDRASFINDLLIIKRCINDKIIKDMSVCPYAMNEIGAYLENIKAEVMNEK